jgi:Trk-type K+ transport system membrane component
MKSSGEFQLCQQTASLLLGVTSKLQLRHSKYLAWHLRRQLAFDIWPLTLAIFLICVVERGQLMDPDKMAWFTVFRVIFECTSAYATIGLSMGTPNNNYSFAGEFSTLSKLIVGSQHAGCDRTTDSR